MILKMCSPIRFCSVVEDREDERGEMCYHANCLADSLVVSMSIV